MSKKIIFQKWQQQAKSTKMQDAEMLNDMRRIIHWMACRPRPTLPRKTKMTQLDADIGQNRRVVKQVKSRPRRSSAAKKEQSKSSIDGGSPLPKHKETGNEKIKVHVKIHNTRAKTAKTNNQKTG